MILSASRYPTTTMWNGMLLPTLVRNASSSTQCIALASSSALVIKRNHHGDPIATNHRQHIKCIHHDNANPTNQRQPFRVFSRGMAMAKRRSEVSKETAKAGDGQLTVGQKGTICCMAKHN